MSSLLKKAPISFVKEKMIKLGNLDSLVKEGKVCGKARKAYFQSHDGDSMVGLCLVNFVVGLQFYHEIKYQDSNFHAGPLFFVCGVFVLFLEEGILPVRFNFCVQVWLCLQYHNLQEGLRAAEIHSVCCG